MRRTTLVLLLAATALTAACSHHKVVTAPKPLVATPAMIDSLWSEALSLYARKKWDKAVVIFERAALEMPMDDPRQRMKFLYVGEARLAQGSNLQAVREFRRLSDQYPSDSLAPRALLRAADAYKALWRRVELDPTYGQTALATYQELLNRYPTSEAAKEGTARVAELNNRFALKKYKDGVFYYKFKAYDSAIFIFRYLVATWPDAAVVPDALGKLVATYRHLGYVDDVRDMCAYYRQHWPSDPKLAATCPATTPPAPADKGTVGH
jgi:outer membrane protein assembly factor BamD